MRKIKLPSAPDISVAYYYLPSALSAAVSVLIFINIVYTLLFVGAGGGAKATLYYLFQLCKFLPLFLFTHLAVKFLPEGKKSNCSKSQNWIDAVIATGQDPRDLPEHLWSLFDVVFEAGRERGASEINNSN